MDRYCAVIFLFSLSVWCPHVAYSGHLVANKQTLQDAIYIIVIEIEAIKVTVVIATYIIVFLELQVVKIFRYEFLFLFRDPFVNKINRICKERRKNLLCTLFSTTTIIISMQLVAITILNF